MINRLGATSVKKIIILLFYWDDGYYSRHLQSTGVQAGQASHIMLAALHIYCEKHICLSLIIAEKRINVKMLPSCAVNYIHPRAGPSGYFIKLKLLSGQQYQNVASCVFIK